MAKRLHPKTIEDKIHQILCKDQDPEPDEVISSKKCYLHLNTSQSCPCPSLSTITYHVRNHHSNPQKNSTFDDGYPRNNCSLNVQTVFHHQQKVKTHISSSSIM